MQGHGNHLARGKARPVRHTDGQRRRAFGLIQDLCVHREADSFGINHIMVHDILTEPEREITVEPERRKKPVGLLMRNHTPEEALHVVYVLVKQIL